MSSTRIRIGDPSRTISGRHRYPIQYRLDSLAPGGRLACETMGLAESGAHQADEAIKRDQLGLHTVWSVALEEFDR